MAVVTRLASTGPDEDTVSTRRPARDVPVLENMFGYGDTKAWGIQLAQDLEDWRHGVIDWDDVDRGIVLSGAPGVGKTIFTQAAAKQCGVKLIATSLGQWQSKGHLGDLLKGATLISHSFLRTLTVAPAATSIGCVAKPLHLQRLRRSFAFESA